VSSVYSLSLRAWPGLPQSTCRPTSVMHLLSHRFWPDVLLGDRRELVAQILIDNASELVDKHCPAQDDSQCPDNSQQRIFRLQNTWHASDWCRFDEFFKIATATDAAFGWHGLLVLRNVQLAQAYVLLCLKATVDWREVMLTATMQQYASICAITARTGRGHALHCTGNAVAAICVVDLWSSTRTPKV